MIHIIILYFLINSPWLPSVNIIYTLCDHDHRSNALSAFIIDLMRQSNKNNIPSFTPLLLIVFLLISYGCGKADGSSASLTSYSAANSSINNDSATTPTMQDSELSDPWSHETSGLCCTLIRRTVVNDDWPPSRKYGHPPPGQAPG